MSIKTHTHHSKSVFHTIIVYKYRNPVTQRRGGGEFGLGEEIPRPPQATLNETLYH